MKILLSPKFPRVLKETVISMHAVFFCLLCVLCRVYIMSACYIVRCMACNMVNVVDPSFYNGKVHMHYICTLCMADP